MQFRHRCFGRPLQGHYPCFPLRTEAKNAAVSATHLSDLYQWRCRRLRYALLEIHLGTCPLYHDLSVPQACLRQRTQKLMAALSWLRGYGPMVPPNTGVLAFRCDVSSCFAHCSKTCPLSFFVPLYRERCYRIVNGPRLLWILQELGEGWALPSLRDRSGQSLNISPMSETTIVNLVHYIIII